MDNFPITVVNRRLQELESLLNMEEEENLHVGEAAEERYYRMLRLVREAIEANQYTKTITSIVMGNLSKL